MKKIFLLLLVPLSLYSQSFSSFEIQKWQAEANRISIIQDDWGIPHIYGKTDADAVFGLMYIQCLQNFSRLEENHLEMQGRLSEVYGKSHLYDDLQMRLIYDSSAAIADYNRSPGWFRQLMDASADGVNYYLYKHPEIKPLVLKRFEPWFVLMRTNGSISSTQTGGIKLQDLKNLYPVADASTSFFEKKIPFYEQDPMGSNGFALAPSKTHNKNSILYINPHTTFYYRTEVHMVSDEGLNAYGAVTWGTFFIFQGFNAHCGWMHTSSYADVADLFRETIKKQGNSLFSSYDGKLLPVKTRKISIAYKTEKGNAFEDFTTYATNHGPVMGSRNGEWLAVRENNRSLNGLLQSWLRTKANGFESFKKIMDLRSNSSDNTVFADDKGNIAYWHGNFIPRRNPKLDYSQPVDGSTSTTDWKGLHTLDEMVHVYNPKSGWIENCNSTPFTASGVSSPKKTDYPRYMAPDGQNGRAVNAIRLLSQAQDVTLDNMIQIGYNHYLSAFDILLPSLFSAYDQMAATNPLKKSLEEPIHYLRIWDRNASASSVATTLAIEWASKLAALIPPARTDEEASNAIGQFHSMVNNTSATDKLRSLTAVIQELESNFQSWKFAWGDMNRYQRTNDGKFDDTKQSWPVGLGPGAWGSIPSFASRRMNTKKRYGLSGNSFIAAVEFGKKITARTVLVSGESFDAASKHYTDQATMYIDGKFKDIYFYKGDILKHKEMEYSPGTETAVD
jgi:acyl-homoserine-lactone acylase